MGLLQVGLGSGIAFGPMLGGAIADAYGYGATFYVTSALLLLAGITVLVGVEEDFRPSEHNQDGRDGFLSQWRALFRTPGVAMTYGMRFVTQLGRMMIIPITPLFVQRLLSDSARVNTFTGLVIGVSAGATTISSIYLGRLGDQIGQRRIVIISSLIAALLYLPQSLVTQGWHLLVLLALVGVAMGGIIPAISALLASYTHPGEEGAVYGMDNSVRAAARSLAPLLGSGVALWFGLRGTFVATAVFFVLAWALALWRLPEPGDILKLPAMRTRTRHW
jgi:DHA1 family multidrug resistance protein-like MFS transporter